MSNQFIAYGSTVERSTDGTTWTTIPECKSLAIPVVEEEYLDATSLDSPDGFVEKIKGMKDAGVLSVIAGYTAASYEAQIADQVSADSIYYRTTLKAQKGQATGDVFEFRAFPTPQVEGDDVKGIVGMTISLRTTGGLDWTKGTAA